MTGIALLILAITFNTVHWYLYIAINHAANVYQRRYFVPLWIVTKRQADKFARSFVHEDVRRARTQAALLGVKILAKGFPWLVKDGKYLLDGVWFPLSSCSDRTTISPNWDKDIVANYLLMAWYRHG